ncbi:MAG: hypothetical protein IKS72_04570, partial [Prevotella sp.]|nr:hypothetical protein [Prevotella sp.]
LVSKDLNIANGTAVTSVKLVDGATLTFDGGGNTNAPKYYNAGESIRMYPKNSVTVKAADGKNIASVMLACSTDSSSGTLCNASGDVSATPGSINISGENLTASGVNNAQVVITNTSGTTGAASQVRFSKIVITYAE